MPRRWVRMAGKQGCERLFLHAFTDGRDTPPDSGLAYVSDMEAFLRAEGLGRIASVQGRYYAMDRDKRWGTHRARVRRAGAR